MKILMLQGGARKNGNTAYVLNLVAEELKKRGHEVSTIYLHGKNLNGCMGCGACKKKPDEIGCVQTDDVNPVLEEMLVSDAIVFSSPLYFWGVNAQLKAVIDRMFSLYSGMRTPEHKSLLSGKKQALIMTGGGPHDNNAECAFIAFKRMTPYLKTTLAGELFVGNCTKPEYMDAAVQEQVIHFVHSLEA